MQIEELEEKLAAVAEKVADFATDIDENVTVHLVQLSATLDDVDQSIGSLSERLTSVNDRFAAVTDYVVDVEEVITQTFSGFHDTLSDADATLEEFAEAVEEVLGRTLDMIVEFRESMSAGANQLVSQTVDSIQEVVIEPLLELRDKLIERLEKFVAEWTEVVMPRKIDEVKDEWLAEIKAELDRLMEELVSGLDSFRDDLVGRTESSGRNRDESTAMQEVLDQALQPVIGELQRVTSLASSVGISIG